MYLGRFTLMARDDALYTQMKIYRDLITNERRCYYTKTDLRQRGWSERLITELLGHPDMRQPNPHHESAAPMLLWRDERVVEAERNAEFVAHQAKRSKRSAAAAASTAERYEGDRTDDL